MRNTENVCCSAAPNLLVQFPLAELTLQLAVDPSKSRQSIPARADGRSQQKLTVDPSKSRWLIPTNIYQPTVTGLTNHRIKNKNKGGNSFEIASKVNNISNIIVYIISVHNSLQYKDMNKSLAQSLADKSFKNMLILDSDPVLGLT
jgi:hypothetical protein